jgi:hypothetical protein
MSQRSAAVRLKISQPLLCKILKNRSDIETSALTNENTDRKRARSGKDSKVESAFKICTSKEEEILEAPPTNAQMREAVRILRRGVQHRATNFQRHYEYEQFIQELLNANKQQATLHTFLNKFCCFLCT